MTTQKPLTSDQKLLKPALKLGTMSARQLRLLLDHAELTQVGAAKLVGVNARTMRAYIAGSPIPPAIAIALRCLAEHV